MKLTFAPAKVTTNTIMFSEVIDTNDPLAQAQVGNLYVPKRTLKDAGWTGNRLTVEIKLGEVVAQ